MKRVLKMFIQLFCLIILASPALAGEVNLSVAASLKDAVNELSTVFARKQPGVKFVKNYGASGALAKQTENGAPADIFISANQEWLDYLKGKKLVDEKNSATFAFNELVFAGLARVASARIQPRRSEPKRDAVTTS